jgi:protocatechuate 3,4-dioxygenase beta subunit
VEVAILDNVVPSLSDVVLSIGGHVEVSGVVVDRTGAPIEGADVNCTMNGEWPQAIVQAVTTDVYGEFHFSDLPVGSARVRVVAAGFAVSRPSVEFPLPRDEILEIELQIEAAFRGIVVDHRGRPVEGALVQVQDRALNTEPSRMVTEPDGSFWSINVPAGHPLEVIVSRSDTWPQVHLGLVAPNESVVLEMLPAATLEGQVVDQDGNAVTEFDLLFTCDSYTWNEEHVVRQMPWNHLQNQDGRFEVRTRPGGTRLDIRAAGFEPSSLSIDGVGPDAIVKLEPIALRRARSVSGRVVDALGKAVEGARVAIADRTRGGEAVVPNGLAHGISDASGFFAVAQTGHGPFDLVVNAEGFGSLLLRDQSADEFPRDLVLETAGAIEGLVRIPWRRPETVGYVVVRPVGSQLSQGSNVDATGQFRFGGLGRGRHWVELFDDWICNQYESPCVVSAVVDVVPGETAFVELESGRGCLVDGEVSAAWKSVRPDRFTIDLFGIAGGQERLAASSATDASGLYCLGLVPPGEYIARLRSREQGWIVTAERELVLRETDTHERVDFKVEGVFVIGRVRSTSGEPVVADVRLVDPSEGRVITSARTDRSGGYSFMTREGESLLAWIESSGFAESFGDRVELRGEAPAIEHVLAPESRVVVVVVDDLGRAVGEVALELLASGRSSLLPPLAVSSDAGGRATITRLGAGTCELHGRRRGYVAAASSRFVLGEGETTNVRLTMMRCGTIEVSVRDDRGEPVADKDVAVSLLGADSEDGERLRSTAADGRARFTDLVPGRYRAEVEGVAPIEIDVEPGGLAKQGVVLPRD